MRPLIAGSGDTYVHFPQTIFRNQLVTLRWENADEAMLPGVGAVTSIKYLGDGVLIWQFDSTVPGIAREDVNRL